MYSKRVILFIKSYRFHNVVQSILHHKYTCTDSLSYYTWLRSDTGYLSIHRYLCSVNSNMINTYINIIDYIFELLCIALR